MINGFLRPGARYRSIINAVLAALTAFLTYASVYAYRKPFTAADFGEMRYGGISWQSLLIICQVIGYMLSKFAGIRFIAALKRKGRWKTAAVLLLSAWLSLFFFAICPDPFSMFFFLVNGFSLGFMWGIVFSYVEGRRATDFIGAVMAVSFIFAGGFTRSIARWLLTEQGVSANWMPFVTGALFVLPLSFFIYLLEKLPPPNETDRQERTERVAMNREDRIAITKALSAGILLVAVTYTLLTVMRDVRDNFMSNMWKELGYADNYILFTQTETKISVIVLVVMGMLVTVRNNFKALQWVHAIVITGLVLAGFSSLLYTNNMLDGAAWMQLTGLGLYMAYIPCNCLLFERLIAAFKLRGNAGFLMYIVDAFGYLGSTAVILTKELTDVKLNWVSFYSSGVLLFSVLGIGGAALSWFYFIGKYRKTKWQQENQLSLSAPV